MQKRKSAPGQMEIGGKSHPRGISMEEKENFAIESFWKEALKADSLLMWIVFNIGHNREERA